MNKWIAIPVIAVLAVAVIGGGYFLWQQTDKLGEAESEIVTLEGDVSALEGDVSTLEGNVSTLEGSISTLEGNVATLETDLADSEAAVSTLEADLRTANSKVSNLQSDVSTQQTINSSLSEELKTVKDPRHFSSTQELADWLQKDTTDEEWTVDDQANYCYVLQVRALRDGFLLPVTWELVNGDLYTYNLAAIGTELYYVGGEDDYTIEVALIFKALPSHPLPLD